MKNILLTFLTVISIASMAEDGLRLEPMYYSVISDEKDPKVNSDEFLLEGNVKMFSSLSPIQNVLIGCTSSGIWTKSKEDGSFSIHLKKSDSRIYFYLDGWNELVIEDYQFNAGHKIVMDVYLVQNRSDEQMIKRKPVIYLYSDKPINAEVKIDPKGEFIFTYPEYKDGWSVSLNKESVLKVEGQTYPYLFWEAKSDVLNYAFTNNSIEGFLIKSDTIVNFFEEQLDLIGLNQTEKTDFITYWGPILSQKEFAFVQFIVDEDYDSKIASLSVKPKPNNSKRVFILCSSIDDSEIGVKVIPQSFKPVERTGFTLIEWGGAVVDFNKLGH